MGDLCDFVIVSRPPLYSEAGLEKGGFMKQLLCAVLALAGLVGVPQEPASPNEGSGDASGYLKWFAANKEQAGSAEARHAARLILQELPDTREYLGSTVAEALGEDLHKLLSEDLKTAVWIDFG